MLADDGSGVEAALSRRNTGRVRGLCFVMLLGLLETGLVLALLNGPARGGDADLQPIIDRHIQPIIPADGGGGAAVTLHVGSRTLFFNYGLADAAVGRPISSDMLFSLASLRKLFEATLLA